MMYWGLTAWEVLHVLYNSPHTTVTAHCGIVPLSYWIGVALTVGGCLLRVTCYRALGHMFTFTFTVQPAHSLITHGPYALVRHPSYAGLMVCLVGIMIAQGSSGSWLRVSGMLETLWGVFIVLVWSCSMGIACICLTCRTRDEDELLKEMFGDEWTSWASRVKYRLLPGVY